MNKKQQLQKLQKWHKIFLAGTDKEIIEMWFDDYHNKIERFLKLSEEYEEEKIILAFCYLDGLARFKYGHTSRKLFIEFLSNYSNLSVDLSTKLYQWSRCFGIHYGKVLGISKTGRINLKSTPPQITSGFICGKLKMCFNKLAKEMTQNLFYG